jgi:cob(I)alamin adenosyltransferase
MSAAPSAGAPNGARSTAGTPVNRECVRYLNRLSDLLFILARASNDGDEPLWEPGRNR